jgi:hypothetical protein
MTSCAGCGFAERDHRVTVRVAPAATATVEALPEIVALLERVFPRTRPWAPDLTWRYLKNPAGPARFVNGYDQSGRLIAHYALLPTPPLADPPVEVAGTYFSLNTAVDPEAGVPGLMVATARALFRELQREGPALLLGVANEKSYQGFVRMLGFRSLGRLSLTFHAPMTLPRVIAPRALATNADFLAWRTARPGVHAYADRVRGALTVRLHHRGIPLDAVLSTGLSRAIVDELALPIAARWAPRLYAGFGSPRGGGIIVPEQLRPSPLEYIFQVLGDKALTEPVTRYLTGRRFEFLDFDVV